MAERLGLAGDCALGDEKRGGLRPLGGDELKYVFGGVDALDGLNLILDGMKPEEPRNAAFTGDAGTLE